MELLRYLQVFRRYGWIVVVFALLGAGSAAYYTSKQPKVYAATATLLINPAAPNQAISFIQQSLQGYNFSTSSLQQLADTYGVYLNSSDFGSYAQKVLNLPYSPAGQIGSNLVGSTNFFEIHVSDTDPLRAERLANGVAAAFIQQNSLLQDHPTQTTLALKPLTTAPLAGYLQKQITLTQDRETRLSASPAADTVQGQQRLSALSSQLSSLITAYNQVVSVQNATQQPQAVNTAKLVGAATVPLVPISPSPRKNETFGALSGIAIGLLLVFLLEYLDYSLRSPEDVESATGQLPMAVIGLVGGRGKKRGANKQQGGPGLQLSGEMPNGSLSPALFSLHNPRDPVSEAFRALRTNLAFSTLGKPIRSIVVTSVVPGEGKSTVAANLAVVLAQSGKRVIIVDADLRRPTLHKIFGLRNVGGFTDLLLSRSGQVQGLQSTAVPNLKVLTSGPLPPNPAELLSSEIVPPLIEALGEQADIVIFDTPPIGALTDAVVLSTRVDGTLVVVRAGGTRPNVISKGLDALKKVGGHPLGVVLNMVDGGSLRPYSYYYYSQTEYADSSQKR